MILPWRGVAALHTRGYRGSAQFVGRRMENGRVASWKMEKDVATSPRQTSRMHASYFSYLLQRMKKFSSSWHVHSTQSPTGIELWEGYCRCFTTDSLPRGYPGQYVRASAYAELDGKRKRQSIYPGSDPRSLIE